MKKTLTIASSLILASAFALGACGKDKKPAAAAPTEPAAAEPAKPTDPAADQAKPAGSAAPKGGW
jgi:hypothetical protein